MRATRLIACLTGILLLGLGTYGCANLKVGRPIATENIQEIRPGYTTKDRTLTLFGQPLRNVPGEDGEIWVYRYLDGKGACQDLVISFTGNLVSTYTYN